MIARNHTEHERESGADTRQAPAAASLPFEYEDRSDGRHARLMAEIAAAVAWTRRQREMGMQPN